MEGEQLSALTLLLRKRDMTRGKMHEHVMCNGKDVRDPDKKGTENIPVTSFVITVTSLGRPPVVPD